MKIEIEVSDNNECTDAPWWIIIDPRQVFKKDVGLIADQITGPFFTRKEAQEHLEGRSYHYSKHAKVYCHSGYYSHQYKTAIRNAREKNRVFTCIQPEQSQADNGGRGELHDNG